MSERKIGRWTLHRILEDDPLIAESVDIAIYIDEDGDLIINCGDEHNTYVERGILLELIEDAKKRDVL
jgi:hypothetical protein